MSSTNEPGMTSRSVRIRADASLRRFEAARNAFAFKMAALHDLSMELSLVDDVDELCRRAVELGQRVLGFDRIRILFVDAADPALLLGSYGMDVAGRIRDERGIQYRRSAEALPEGFYESKEPVYYMGAGPCYDERHQAVGEAERALALLWDGRKVVGEIWVDNLVTRRPIDGGSIELLVRFARIVGSLSSLKRVQAELMRLSSTDALTGVVNRRTVLVVLEKQFSLATRKGDDLAVIYCDLDGLKAVNDTLGHAAGDEYIKIASSILLDSLRDCDTVGRLGGDEFLIVLPDCDLAGASLIEARIEAAAAEVNSAPRLFEVSISRGIATCGELENACNDLSTQALIDLADRRMYEAKRGRKS
jgi:diguanylate cyclase (GGDEF)-like protein